MACSSKSVLQQTKIWNITKDRCENPQTIQIKILPWIIQKVSFTFPAMFSKENAPASTHLQLCLLMKTLQHRRTSLSRKLTFCMSTKTFFNSIWYSSPFEDQYRSLMYIKNWKYSIFFTFVTLTIKLARDIMKPNMCTKFQVCRSNSSAARA